MLRNSLKISERFSLLTNELHLHDAKNESIFTEDLLEILVAAFNSLSENKRDPLVLKGERKSCMHFKENR